VKPRDGEDPLARAEPVGATSGGRVLYRKGGRYFTYWAWGDELIAASPEEIASARPTVDRQPVGDGTQRFDR
jgi:hypothetical protein